MDGNKYVIVVDKHLSAGLKANAAAVLATSIGHAVQGVLGPDVEDASGTVHQGITHLPIAILATDGGQIARLRRQAADVDGLYVVGFTSTAQKAKRYEDYELRLAMLDTDDLAYVGLGLCGPAGPVTELTRALPLLK